MNVERVVFKRVLEMLRNAKKYIAAHHCNPQHPIALGIYRKG